MDKDHKEALQVAKELTAKFIETRTVSPNNFAEIFPSIYRVVYSAIQEHNSTNESICEPDNDTPQYTDNHRATKP